jgi:molybdopterin molybdotransferase
MPGNPVSSFVQFEVLVKPFLVAMMGNSAVDTYLYLPMEVDYVRKKADQLYFVPVTFTDQGTVVPVDYHGSAHIHAYTRAQGIMEIPKGVFILKKGETACVRPI